MDADPRALRAPVAVAWSITADVGGLLRALREHVSVRAQPVTGDPVPVLTGPAQHADGSTDGARVRDWSSAHGQYLRLSTPDGAARQV